MMVNLSHEKGKMVHQYGTITEVSIRVVNGRCDKFVDKSAA